MTYITTTFGKEYEAVIKIFSSQTEAYFIFSMNTPESWNQRLWLKALATGLI